ncbi:MAG: glycosyltransferase family 9 protein [Candidatus Poribacteria bacterium]
MFEQINELKHEKILLIRFGSLGDVVLTLPVVEAIKKSFPNVYIAMLVSDKCANIISADPRFNEIIAFRRETKGKEGLTETNRVISLLRERKFDISIDMQRKFQSAYFAYKGNIKTRIGYHQPFGFLCNVKIPNKVNKHSVDRNLDLIKPLGIDNAERVPKIYLSDEDRDFAKSIFDSYGIIPADKVLGIFPGAGWRPRCWLPERFAKIADLAIKNDNAKVVIFCGPNESDIVDDVVRNMNSKPYIMKEKVTQRQLAAMIEKCDVMLSNDTGPMHISVGVGTTTIALFGPGNHIKFQPIGEKHSMIRKDVPCSPCKQFTDKCKDNICMKLITVDDVWDAVHKKLMSC